MEPIHEAQPGGELAVEPEQAQNLGARPRRGLAVVTCMDARIEPISLLGLDLGDAHIVRNAGGLVTDDVIRSLCVSQRVLGTSTIVLIMHEGCGLHRASDTAFAEALARDQVPPQTWTAGAFADLEATLRRGLELLRSNVALPVRDRIYGFIFDPERRALRGVEGVEWDLSLLGG
jgi:carbonic anhydrase